MQIKGMRGGDHRVDQPRVGVQRERAARAEKKTFRLPANTELSFRLGCHIHQRGIQSIANGVNPDLAFLPGEPGTLVLSLST